jgi:hypothetical protein
MPLEIRPCCENCGRDLEPASTDVFICSFECTYCAKCTSSFDGVCPNCGGELVRRPVRPARLLLKYPASTVRIVRPAAASSQA